MIELDGREIDSSIHDKDFGWDDAPVRRIVDDGRLVPDAASGGLRRGSGSGRGAGTWDVTVGDRRFTCLRVIDYDDTDTEFGEAYLTATGRVVAYRQFRPASYDPDWRDWQERHPTGDTHTIEGTRFFHRDCTGLCLWVLTDTALQG